MVNIAVYEGDNDIIGIEMYYIFTSILCPLCINITRAPCKRGTPNKRGIYSEIDTYIYMYL